MVVFPAFALPMTSTRNWIFGIGRDCFVSIAFVSIVERQSQESIRFSAPVHTLIKYVIVVIFHSLFHSPITHPGVFSRYQLNDSVGHWKGHHLTGPEDSLIANNELLSPQFHHMIMSSSHTSESTLSINGHL